MLLQEPVVSGLLDRVFFGSSARQWSVASLAAVGVFTLLLALRAVAGGRLRRLSRETETQIDDLAIDLVERTHAAFLALLALWLAAALLDPATNARPALRIAMVAVTVLQAGRWGTTIIVRMVEQRSVQVRATDRAQVTTLAALSLVLRLVFYAILVLVALENFGIDVTALVAGLGIGGVAVALATQNILGDLFASLSIVLDKPFVIGDFIIVGDLKGTVEYIGLKTTRLRSLSGEQLIFSNTDLVNSRVRNFQRMHERRVEFSIGVTYDTPPDKLREIPLVIRSIVEGEPGTRFERAHFKDFGESALGFETVYWVLDPDYSRYMNIQERINLAIVRQFSGAGIDFAYPTRTVLVRREPVDAAP